MVQDSSALAPFFRAQIEKNNQYNSVWGKHYRQLVEQIQAENQTFLKPRFGRYGMNVTMVSPA